MNEINVGIIGCGNISGIYLKNLTGIFSDVVDVYAVCDLIAENAKNAAERYGVENIMTFEEILDCKEIDLILNLTTPWSHFDISSKALKAGKHVYSEKPLALTFEEGEELVRLAEERGLHIGCAPDTFMGAGVKTAKQLIDEGEIGRPVGGNAFMMCHGHESWHPNPAFYYKQGGGPMLDMGPYYLTALYELLGPVEEVVKMNSRLANTRTVTSKERYGEIIDVEVQTHVSGLLRYANGAIVSITTSFDVWSHSMPNIELYGDKGSLKVPDPNQFSGAVKLAVGKEPFKEIPLAEGFIENSRGAGVADMSSFILGKTKSYRARGDIALHVLEVMCALADKKDSGTYHITTCPGKI